MTYRNTETQLAVIPKKKRHCWFFHKWVPTLKNPFESGYLKTIFDVACLQCSKCGKTKELSSMSSVNEAQRIFSGKYTIRAVYG